MSKFFNHRRLRTAGRSVGIVVLLFLLLGLSIASCSPKLHQLICPQAGQADDFCAIKQFQCGSVEALLAQADLGLPSFVFVAKSHCVEELHLASPLFRLSPSRAPPFELARG